MCRYLALFVIMVVLFNNNGFSQDIVETINAEPVSFIIENEWEYDGKKIGGFKCIVPNPDMEGNKKAYCDGKIDINLDLDKTLESKIMIQNAIEDMVLEYPLNFYYLEFLYFGQEMKSGYISFNTNTITFFIKFDENGKAEGKFNFELVLDKYTVDSVKNKEEEGGIGGE